VKITYYPCSCIFRHETTSSAFTWTCYLLAIHPKIQSILRAEIRSALPLSQDMNSDDEIANIMERLPYLNAIINETLRLYPTVPVTIRVARQDTHLVGHYVPKGTEIMISPWLINRSKHVWGEDAEQFRPERWIDQDTGKPNNMGGAASNYDYLTFLHGPRSCIGQGFAKAELRCMVAAMVRKFEWDLDMDQKDVIPGGAITIKPMKGLHVKLRVAP
jgi:cytochrome P450